MRPKRGGSGENMANRGRAPSQISIAEVYAGASAR